ncbi:MAG TPA: 2-phosphosulfolactate phosphatase [Candidatus Sulfotelmatobacter sp.]|nr:2-phosphosulfolactate phosphatase [Candidatus Sulfotelmatobacter sp.]
MNLDVILTPAEFPGLAKRDLRKTVCVVFDVLRATSAFVTALHNGAAAIIPVSEISEALEIKKKRPAILTAGERHGVKIRVKECEFDFGNSPREFTSEKVKERTLVSTTTNGTRALRACAGAKTIFAAAFLNLAATAKWVRKKNPENVLLICAGTGENAALEDILAAGALCEALLLGKRTPSLSDSSRVALATFTQAKGNLAEAIYKSENARHLLSMPELRPDVEFCLSRDVFHLVAGMKGNKMVKINSAGSC